MTNPNAQFYTEWDDQNLSPQENAFAHNLAIDLAGRKHLFNNIQQLNDAILEAITNQFGNAVDQSKADVLFKSIYDRTQELLELQAKGRSAERDYFEAKGTDVDKDRFVRVMPKPVLNPQVGGDLAGGNIQRAARGFWNKLDRAVRLFSSDGYDLKSSRQLNNPQLGSQFVEKIANSQADLGFNIGQKMVLAETVKALGESIEELEGKIKDKSKQIDKLRDQYKEVKEVVAETEIFLDDLGYSLKIEQFEADQNSGTWLDRAAGKVIAGPALALFARKDSEKYSRAYAMQAEAEADIIKLESDLKKALEMDLADFPIAENENAKAVYDAAGVTLKDFVDRQGHLENRLAALKELVESRVYHLEAERNRLKDQASSEKMHKLSHQAELKNIKKFEKGWQKLSGAEMERLFWYQFGDQITMIRDWQGRLPIVNRLGRTAYQAQTTAVFRQYVELRERVKAFEEAEGVVGMLAILDRELGTMKFNGSSTNVRAQQALTNWELVKRELAFKKQRRPLFMSADVNDAMPGPAPTDMPRENLNQNAISSNQQSQVSAQGAAQPDLDPAKQAKVEALDASQPQVTGAISPGPKTVDQVSIDQTAQAAQIAVQGALEPAVEPLSWVQLDLDFNKPVIEVKGALLPDTEVANAASIDKDAPAPKEITVKEDSASTAETKEEERKEQIISEDQLSGLDKSVEIVRPSETLIVGDLNGNLEVLQKSLVALKAVEIDSAGNWKWTAGNRELVLLGDILADRTAQGLKILEQVRVLREQATAQGGGIKIIFGNHEDFAVSFLTERKVFGTGEEKDSTGALNSAVQAHFDANGIKFGWQGLGVLEFIANYTNYGKRFKGDIDALRKQIEDDISANNWPNLTNLPAEALVAMQNSESGQKIIDEICKMELVARDGDTLIIHTEPTNAILIDLASDNDLDAAIAKLNGKFQQGLKVLLTGSGKLPDDGEFSRLINTFASPDNRYFVQAMAIPQNRENLARLAKMGIKRITHGHTPLAAGDSNRLYKAADLIEIANVDFGAGRAETPADVLPVAVLGKRSELALGVEQVEKIEAFDAQKQSAIKEVGEWLNMAFPLLENEHDAWAVQMVETLRLNSEAEVKTKLTEELAEFFVKVWDAVSKKSTKPTLATIGKMINFYTEWVAVDKRPLAEKVAEIGAMNLPFGQEIVDAWRQKHGQKPQSAGEVRHEVASAAAKALEAEPSEKNDKVESEDLKAITQSDLRSLNEDELEKKARAMVQAVFGSKDTVNMILEGAKIKSPKKYLTYLSSILLYPEALALLFTLKFKGKKMTKDGKVKGIDSKAKLTDLDNSNVAKVLANQDVLAQIEKFLAEKTETEIAQILAGFKSTLGWFNTFLKK